MPASNREETLLEGSLKISAMLALSQAQARDLQRKLLDKEKENLALRDEVFELRQLIAKGEQLALFKEYGLELSEGDRIVMRDGNCILIKQQVVRQ